MSVRDWLSRPTSHLKSVQREMPGAFTCPAFTLRSQNFWAVVFASSTCFSRMRSKGSRFTLGVWRLRVCSLDVAHRPQPFATVRHRSPPSATVRARSPWPCKSGQFWRFQTSRGRRGTCDLPTCLMTCPKPFCVTGAIFLCRF